MGSIFNGLVFLLINGLAIFSSWCLSGRLVRREDGLALAVVAAGLIYFAHITVVVLFLGAVLKVLNVYSVAAASALVSGALILLFRSYRPAFLQPARLGLSALFTPQVYAARDLVLYLVAALFVLQVLILLAKIIWLPPHIWDVFFYHLTPAVEWFQQGRIPLQIDTPAQNMNHVPLGMTVLDFWFFIFFRHDFLVELPMFLWALLLVPTTYATLRRAELEPGWSFKFAVLVFFIPIVLAQAVTDKDHLGLNVGFVAGLLFLAESLRARRTSYLLVAAVAFGLILGYKQAAPIYIAIAGALFLIFAAVNDRGLLSEPSRRAALLKTSALALVIMAAIGSFWYVRRFLVAHGFSMLPPERALPGEAGEAGRFSADALIHNLAEFLPRVFDFRLPFYGADLPGISGFGPQFAAFGLIAVLVGLAFLFRKSEYRRPLFLLTAAALALFALYLPTNYSANNNSYRILSFLPMVMIPYAAILLHRYGALERQSVAKAVNFAIVASLAWNLFTVLPPKYTNLRLFKEFVTLDDGYRSSARYTQWAMVHRPDLYRLLGSIPAREPIGLIAQPRANFPGEPNGQTWSYLYYDRNWSRKVVYLNQPDYVTCNERFVCVPKPALPQALQDKGVSLVSLCMNNRCLRLVDPHFIELTPGFYYYEAEPHVQG